MATGRDLGEARGYWQAARDVIGELEELITEFFDARPYEIRVENISGNDVYRMRLAARIPRRFGRLSARVVKDLHSALETVMAELTGKASPAYSRSRQFPFASSAEKFDALISGYPAQWSDDVIAALRMSKPYPEGDKILYALLAASRTAPRKLLIARAFANAVLVHQQQNALSGSATLSAPIWNPRRREVLMLGADPGGQLSGRAQVQFFIALRDIDPISDIPVITVFKHQLRVVDRLITALERPRAERRPPHPATRQPPADIDTFSG